MNPVIDQVTNLVVKEDASPNTEYIVPVDVVAATTADTIRLRCSKAELEQMDPFVETRFVEETKPEMDPGYGGGSMEWDILLLALCLLLKRQYTNLMEYQQIPPGELAVRRGTRGGGDGWLRGQSRRIRGQPGERPHYPFGDAGRTSVGTEGCDYPSFGMRQWGKPLRVPCS